MDIYKLSEKLEKLRSTGELKSNKSAANACIFHKEYKLAVDWLTKDLHDPSNMMGLFNPDICERDCFYFLLDHVNYNHFKRIFKLISHLDKVMQSSANKKDYIELILILKKNKQRVDDFLAVLCRFDNEHLISKELETLLIISDLVGEDLEVIRPLQSIILSHETESSSNLAEDILLHTINNVERVRAYCFNTNYIFKKIELYNAGISYKPWAYLNIVYALKVKFVQASNPNDQDCLRRAIHKNLESLEAYLSVSTKRAQRLKSAYSGNGIYVPGIIQQNAISTLRNFESLSLSDETQEIIDRIALKTLVIFIEAIASSQGDDESELVGFLEKFVDPKLLINSIDKDSRYLLIDYSKEQSRYIKYASKELKVMAAAKSFSL